jgi:hypothetical protein
MRRQWRRRAGQTALLALLLQLVLPLLTVHQARAEPGPALPFVICTGGGLVWIDPEGRQPPDGGGPDDGEPTQHCPICFSKQLSAALPPTAAAPSESRQHATSGVGPQHSAPPLAAASAPPLPPRGPPFAA